VYSRKVVYENGYRGMIMRVGVRVSVSMIVRMMIVIMRMSGMVKMEWK
jgi:hypothetical protein